MITLRKTAADIQVYLIQHNIEAEILMLQEDTPTVPDAARVLNVEPDQIIKSLVFLTPETPILVIANGIHKVDKRKIAKHLGIGQKKVKFASAERALNITGYIVGSMPPFGHKTQLPTYIDSQIMTLSTLFGGGGDIHAMLKLTPATLVSACKAELLAISEGG